MGLRTFDVTYTVTHTKRFRVIDEAQIRGILNESNGAEIISIQEITDEKDMPQNDGIN